MAGAPAAPRSQGWPAASPAKLECHVFLPSFVLPKGPHPQALQQRHNRQAVRPSVQNVACLHQRRAPAGPAPISVDRARQPQRRERLVQVAMQVSHRQQRRIGACGKAVTAFPQAEGVQ